MNEVSGSDVLDATHRLDVCGLDRGAADNLSLHHGPAFLTLPDEFESVRHAAEGLADAFSRARTGAPCPPRHRMSARCGGGAARRMRHVLRRRRMPADTAYGQHASRMGAAGPFKIKASRP